ncbi:hypothetical protein BDY24DRAFT_392945 [Mrakia frigida]|uniref:uncharacterized protein n=1 Tax=Mrakia frigida TaxID=29902 RepID=UPI003FCBFE67
MLPLLRRSILAKALTLQPRAPLITIITLKSFSSTPSNQNITAKRMDAAFAKTRKEEGEMDLPKYRPEGSLPVNPPYEHTTWENADFVGITCLPNGDPIGFDTSAEGLTPEEAYWYGVQGWQDHEDQHRDHERGFHTNLDGFIRTDERGPHQDFVNGGWFFDTKDGGKRYLEGM